MHTWAIFAATALLALLRATASDSKTAAQQDSTTAEQLLFHP